MPSAFSDPQPTGDAEPAVWPAALLRLPFVQAVRRGLERAGVGTTAAAQRREKLLLAVSGGPDSMAMLVALWGLQDELGLELAVCSIDHGLRSESAREAETVREVALRLGLAAEVVRVTVPRTASKMSAARTARYHALRDVGTARGISTVAVAHTLQDQSETLLQRWLGGAGLRGLSGMAPRAPLLDAPDAAMVVVRPLLALSRREVCDFLAPLVALIAPLPLVDPTNADRRYQRSRLRHDILPILRRESPRLDRHLAELAAQLGADADYLERVAAETLAALRLRGSSSTARSEVMVTLPRAELAALPRAISTRVLLLAVGRSLSRRHIESLLALCATGAGTQSLTLPGGIIAERRYDELHLGLAARATSEREPSEWPLALSAGVQRCGGVDLEVVFPFTGPLPEMARRGQAVCLPLPDAPLLVRAPRTGDRIRLPSGTRKLSDLLTDRKVPRPERARVRVVCAGETIVWVIGHRAAALRSDEENADARSRPQVLVRLLIAADQEQDLVGG